MSPELAFATHGPKQDEWELAELVSFLRRTLDVRLVLEIGTHCGGSARYWRDVLGAEVITVDKEEHDGDLADITAIGGLPSAHAETVRRVREAVAGRPVDFLFIDGGHSYPEVCGDHETYGSFVRSGGVVAFHDIGAGVGTSPKGCHVALLWDELKRKGGRTVSWMHGQGTGAMVV